MVLDTKKIMVKSGKKTIIILTLVQNRMRPMLSASKWKDKKSAASYNRHIRDNLDSRDLWFLTPEKTIGFKVISLPLCGS